MKNIILFNTAIATSNLGDEIIMEDCRRAIAPVLEDSFVVEYGTHVKNLGISHYIFKSTKRDFSKKCDYKFIMGTNLLTNNVFRSARQWPVCGIESRLYRGSVLLGVGTTRKSNGMDPYTKSFYKRILRTDIAHSVRDEESVELLSCVPGISVINTGCPTLWALTDEVCAKIPVQKATNVIVSVSGYPAQRDRTRDAAMIETLEKNYDRIYLWVQTTADYGYYRSLSPTKKFKSINNLSDFKKVCQNGSVDYVGTRLHGGIFAMQNRVRSLVVEIDHRAAGFRRTNSLNTIKRAEIDRLEDVINSEFKTQIVIKEREIREWKAQFGIK